MSGASGKIPSAIHISPEAFHGGPLGKLKDGDIVRVCAANGELTALVDPAEWEAREQAAAPPPAMGTGRELFAMMRHHSDPAEKGGSAMLAEAGL
jgi:phosphogluconate dehydratase